jgi:hypothetical protein
MCGPEDDYAEGLTNLKIAKIRNHNYLCNATIQNFLIEIRGYRSIVDE